MILIVSSAVTALESYSHESGIQNLNPIPSIPHQINSLPSEHLPQMIPVFQEVMGCGGAQGSLVEGWGSHANQKYPHHFHVLPCIHVSFCYNLTPLPFLSLL